MSEYQYATDYQKVRQFNIAAEQPCPSIPSAMTIEEVRFVTKMLLDELSEFMVTLVPDYKMEMIKMIRESRDLEYNELVGDALIAEQGDALIDMYYYAMNASVKRGINLSKIFNTVHEANMAKKDPITGKFLRREDGKIIKPKNWVSPDIVKVVQDMRLEAQMMNNLANATFSTSSDDE